MLQIIVYRKRAYFCLTIQGIIYILETSCRHTYLAPILHNLIKLQMNIITGISQQPATWLENEFLTLSIIAQASLKKNILIIFIGLLKFLAHYLH